MIEKIVSGGQTGVDRAALDLAIELSMDYGGWCPKGRIDEYGLIPIKYSKLKEVAGNFENEFFNYSMRTISNIRDSDGTLIIVPTMPLPERIKDGTLLTLKEVESRKKPNLLISADEDIVNNIQKIRDWTELHQIKILNVAGPRESSSPGIYQTSIDLLRMAVIVRPENGSSSKIKNTV